MDSHIKAAYHILNLLLNYSTAFKQQLTFLQYPEKYLFVKEIDSFLYHLNSRKYCFLWASVYCITHFYLPALVSLSIRLCHFLMM